MRIKWQGDIEKRRIELLLEGNTYKEIAITLGEEFNLPVTEKSVSCRCDRTKINQKNIINIIKENREQDICQSHENLFSDELYDINEDIFMSPEKLRKINEIYKDLKELKPKKILSLSDLHAPGIDFKAVEKAVQDNLDADICVLNGDVLDLQAFSKFDKLKDIDLEEELNQVFALLDVLTKKYKKVVWVGGNHDLQRFLRYVSRNFVPSIKKFVLDRLNPIEYIAEKYDNVIVVPHDWVQINDVLFAHFEYFSSVDMKTVVNNKAMFDSMVHLLPEPNYKGIVIGHTHKVGKIVRNGVTLIEQGCLCHMQDYRFMKPTPVQWQQAYAIVEFDDNQKMICNKINFIIV